MPRVTAIILTHDRLPMLRLAVASALWQTHDDLEILVVANGVTSETASWLATIEDPRVRVLTLEANLSPPRARNLGLQEATGEWVGFLDDDDLWAPDKVSEMVGAATRTGRRWAYCGTVFVDPTGAVMMGRPTPPLETVVRDLPVLYSIPGGLSGVMWEVGALGADPLLDESMTYCNDWDLALRLLAGGLPAAVDRPLVGYRLHPGAWSRTVADKDHEFDLIAAKHAALRDGRRVHKGEHYRYVAAQASRAGDRAAAVMLYLKGIMHGDHKSAPRLVGALLPPSLQARARRRFLSRPGWLSDGSAWVADLHARA